MCSTCRIGVVPAACLYVAGRWGRGVPSAAASCCQPIWLGLGREAWVWAQGVGAGRGRGGNPKYFFGDSEDSTFTSYNSRFRAVRSDYFFFNMCELDTHPCMYEYFFC